MSDTCFICKELLSVGDVVEVRRGLQTLKNASIARGDGNIEYLNTTTFVKVHSDCRRNYTNSLSIAAFKRRQEEPSTSISPRKKRIISFDFKKLCLFCGEEASEVIKRKKGKKYRRVIREVSTFTFKDTVLKAAEARDDKYVRSVKKRVNFEYDLVSVEAKYHEKCFFNFLLVSGKGDAGRPLDENIRIAIENVFHYIDNNDDCQFTLAGKQQKLKQKSTAIAHAIMSVMRPRSFSSQLLLSLSVFLHRKYASKRLLDVLSSFGFCALYSDAVMYKVSTVYNPQPRILSQPDVILQYAADNRDINVSTIDGHNTVHIMGVIKIISPSNAVVADMPIMKCKSKLKAEDSAAVSHVPLLIYENNEVAGSSSSPTAQLWLQYIGMISIANDFIRAERLGLWNDHLISVQRMLPYFHASGHFLYAKSAHLYLQDMIALKDKMDNQDYINFTKTFAVRRTEKFNCGTWTDMTIEQSLMKSMKTEGGVSRGRSTHESVLSKWIYGMHATNAICEEIEKFCDLSFDTADQHVDSRDSRIERDNTDIKKLVEWFALHDPFSSRNQVVSVSTGIVGNNKINCYTAKEIGLQSIKKNDRSNIRQNYIKTV